MQSKSSPVLAPAATCTAACEKTEVAATGCRRDLYLRPCPFHKHVNIMNLAESEVQCPVALLAPWLLSPPSRRQRPSSYPATDGIAATFNSTTQLDSARLESLGSRHPLVLPGVPRPDHIQLHGIHLSYPKRTRSGRLASSSSSSSGTGTFVQGVALRLTLRLPKMV